MNEPGVPELATTFLFNKRAIPIPADLRPGWRIAIILLLLKNCCRQQRSSFARLHVLNWGVRTKQSQDALTQAAEGILPPDTLLVRIEPSLNRAVDLAIGEKLLTRAAGDHLELTALGLQIADDIERRDDTYQPERQFMNRLGKRVTEKLIKQVFGAEATNAAPTT
jgi:hypothetical protein